MGIPFLLLMLGIFFTAVWLFFLIVAVFERAQRFVGKRLAEMSFTLFLSFWLVAMLMFFSALGVFIANIVIDAESTLSSFWWIPTTLIFGIFFFQVRTAWPVVYGLIECFFAIIGTIISILSKAEGPLPRFLALAASIYIIVRGLDNIDKGITDKWRFRFNFIFQAKKQAP